jgi:hypothetical protein
MSSMREKPVADDKAQFEPFQMKYGTVAGVLVLIPKFVFPAMAPQMVSASAPPKRISSPFSLELAQSVRPPLTLVLVQVRIAALMICIGVKRFTGGRPLNPGGPCGPVAPVSPFGP